MQACNDIALNLLCELLERPQPELHPDGMRYSGCLPVYERLIDLQVLKPSGIAQGGISCPWCGSGDLQSLGCYQGTYQGYCSDCGDWLDLAVHQVTMQRLDAQRIVQWLAAALRLRGRFQTEALAREHLWRLGEIEHRRKRRTVLFGRRLDDAALTAAFDQALQRMVAPGAGVLITTTKPDVIPSALSECRIVPLRAVAHLRKAGFALENFEAYLEDPPAPDETDESSLRLLHSQQVVLIRGQQIHVPLQVYDFLRVLEDAEGEEVDKEAMADALDIKPAFRLADIFKRHRIVQGTFVDTSKKGRYRLRSEFLAPDDP